MSDLIALTSAALLTAGAANVLCADHAREMRGEKEVVDSAGVAQRVNAANRASTITATRDPDTDGDGLSDFHEEHKYRTDPRSIDSDGDGIPDGDWDERREFTYTLRSIVQVLPPVTPDILCDDWQDARVLDRTPRYVELEVIHYPLCTAHTEIVSDPAWRETIRANPGMEYWIRPGPTANWDEPMRDALVTALAEDGIDVTALDDVTLVKQASRWLLEHARYEDRFTTFCTRFTDGQPEIHPAIHDAGRDDITGERVDVEAAWERELFARGMFRNGVRGSCTSSAIYLNGCLRALGVPTRIVLTIPVIDASDEREAALVERLENHAVRETILAGVSGLRGSWASHTFNEVFVGGRWRRLNYDRLGQPTLDRALFGLITHVATFSDWADGDMASTWGVRQHQPPPDDPFGGPNPYSAIALSDRFGVHAQLDNPPAPDFYQQLTIDRIEWFESCEAAIDMRLDEPDTAGHLVVRVREGRPGAGAAQYSRFYERVSKQFRLEAPRHEPIPLRATRGYWAAPEKGLQHFYLRIEPRDFALMERGVTYTLRVADERGKTSAAPATPRWVVEEGVSIVRSADSSPGGERRAADVAVEATNTLRLGEAYWSDSAASPTGPLPGLGRVILVHMGASADFDRQKTFTSRADLRFVLEAPGRETVAAQALGGGVTTRSDSYLIVEVPDQAALERGVEYVLRPLNESGSARWTVAEPIRLTP